MRTKPGAAGTDSTETCSRTPGNKLPRWGSSRHWCNLRYLFAGMCGLVLYDESQAHPKLWQLHGADNALSVFDDENQFVKIARGNRLGCASQHQKSERTA